MKEFLAKSDRYSNVIGILGLFFLLIGFFLQIFEINQTTTKFSILFTGIGIVLLIYFLAIILFGYESMIYESDIKGVERFVERISNDLDRDGLSILKEYTPRKVVRIAKNIETSKRIDLIRKMFNKFIPNIDSNSKGIRLKTVRLSKSIIPEVQREKDIKTYTNITDRFIEASKKEVDKKVYLELADVLEEASRWFLREESVDKTADIVELFKTHRDKKDDGFKNRWKLAEKILKRLPDKEFIDFLIKHLRSDDENVKILVYGIIRNLEEGAILPMVRSLEKIYDKTLRQIVIISLKNFEEASCLLVLRELDRKISSNYVKIIVDVLSEIGYEDIVVEHLRRRLNGYSKIVRPYVLEFLEKIA